MKNASRKNASRKNASRKNASRKNVSRKNVSRNCSVPYLTRRKVKSVVATANTVYGEEKYVMKKTCNKCDQEKIITCYYVKPYRQHIPEDQLNENDFRDKCIKCFDAEKKQNHAMVRLKNKKMVRDIEQFLSTLSEEQLENFKKIVAQVVTDRKIKNLKKDFNITDFING